MTFKLTATIGCDGLCGKTIDVYVYETHPLDYRPRLNKKIRRERWTVVNPLEPYPTHYCPDCAKRLNKLK
jgi:hypothetical protein